MKTVYLAGPIHGRSDDECNGWRSVAKQLLTEGNIILDPMDRDFRGVEDANVREIVLGDIDMIRRADWVLVNANEPSWGTAMEIVYASKAMTPVIAFTAAPSVSPWLRYHCLAIFKTLEDACRRHNASSFVESCR
jgi:nucleoside 2-deoxyribosyltransferase